jgi:hypothetical protein
MTVYRINIELGSIGFEIEAKEEETEDDVFEIAKEIAIEEGISYDILEQSVITLEKLDAEV